MVFLCFFFKQKTAYEMRISDWSSDVCSSDLSSVAGGWSSSRLMKAGWSANAARKLTMLVCAFCVLPIFFAQSIDSVWIAVLVIGLATAAHQAFSANLYTLPSDIFPRGAVGSVVGKIGRAHV